MKFYCSPVFFMVLSLSLGAREHSPSEMRDEVAFLSDSRLSGRECGTPGGRAAAVYIYDQFRAAGLDVYATPVGTGGLNVWAETESGGDRHGTIVIAAHYDGIGMTADGKVCPGADANASGVAAMLELARTFAGDPPEGYTVTFVALDSHFDGLAGAYAFASSLGKRKIRMFVNLDTIGSDLAPVMKHWKNYLIVLGGAPWYRSIERCNEGLGLSLSYDYYGSRNFTDIFFRKKSDQRPFLERGIPCVMFTSGITLNTNHPEDGAGTLNYPLMARRITLVERWVRTL